MQEKTEREGSVGRIIQEPSAWKAERSKAVHAWKSELRKERKSALANGNRLVCLTLYVKQQLLLLYVVMPFQWIISGANVLHFFHFSVSSM